MHELRAHYPLNDLLRYFEIPRSTYYERLKASQKVDKYRQIKEAIKKIFHQSHETYGYRRIHVQLIKANFSISPETIRRLMNHLRLKVSVYSKRSHYSSYSGNVGRIASNILKQKFNEHRAYHVLHTDITQFKLTDHQFGYISAVIDEASNEVLAAQVSASPNQVLIKRTIAELKTRLPTGSRPILHSDQGWHYQLPYYRNALAKAHFQQSMSRKGNCLDNAPIESFFNLLKRECLKRIEISSIKQLQDVVQKYVHWFNYERISLNHNHPFDGWL
ncbi:IS3 family transposase [Limosilactobacillus reuteri]|uniref:IS3 family transposase n=1 Tax=Limosilactobacillus reuteri TaxID=1598 RepID=UPI001E5D3212|nr:IS3 family transposase [Limosilactobacillus reuteri]